MKTLESRLQEIKSQMEGLLGELSEIQGRLERDDLTQLLRRQAFFERLEGFRARAEHERKVLGLLVVDIDHFKKINDTHGHLVGDEALKNVAAVCRKFESERVLGCRFGGEEFVIAVMGSEAEIAALAEQVRTRVATETGAAAQNVPCTVSIGVAFEGSERIGSIESMLKSADRALYQAKEGGRNCVVIAQEAA